MKREYYDEEMMVKEAITTQKSDKEIGMPDIESELKRVKAMAKRPQPMISGWRRIAAVCALVLSISGITWAVAYYQQYQAEAAQTEQQVAQTDDVQVGEVQDEELQEATVSEQLTLSYDKASLEQIVVDLTAFYHLEKPEFRNIKAARKCKLHVTINPESDIQEAVALLNQFGSIKIEIVENKLIVK